MGYIIRFEDNNPCYLAINSLSRIRLIPALSTFQGVFKAQNPSYKEECLSLLFCFINASIMSEIYTVYVLYSDAFDKHYTGFTSRLEERIKSHNELSGKGYTRRYRPWRLIFQKEFTSKVEAMSHEKWLKSGVGRDFIKTIQH